MTIGLLRTLPVIVLVVFGLIPNTHAFLSPTNLMLAADGGGAPNSFVVDWQAVIGTMGVTGVLVWYLYYTTSAAFPKIREDFRQEMAAERAHHSKLQDEANDRVNKVCESIDDLSEQLRTKPCLLGKIPGKHE